MQNIHLVAERLKKRLEIIWDRSAEEIDELIKYDPVVKLVFYSVIFQFEDVIYHQQNFQKEILADLAKRLMPDVKYYSSPAFGILKTYSTGKEIFELAEDKTFFTQRVINEKMVSLNFIPLFQTEIVPAKLLAIANNKVIIDLTEKKENNIFKANNNFENSEYFIWLGLKINPQALKSLKRLQLYFDYDIADINNRLFFDELLNSNWSFNKTRCLVSNGFTAYSGQGTDHIFESSNFGQIKNRVSNFYSKNFLNISLQDDRANFFNPVIPQESEKNLADIIWIQVESKSAIPIDFFIENSIHLNAFPVINCDVKKDRLTKNEIAKQFDLNENEYFFDLWNSDNDKFRIRDVRLKSFDYRNLSSELRVLDRLFNQSRVLFDTNLNLEDEDINVFRKFSNIISDLKIRFKKEGINYPQFHIEANEYIDDFKSYKYLTTYGKSGNGGEIGECFGYNSPGLIDKTTVALSKFWGGSNQKEEDTLIEDFRYSLLSRGRIVSREDIKALAFSVFGKENVQNILIHKDVTSGINNIGLSKLIRITIHLSEKKIANQLVDFLKKDMVTQLEMNSVIGTNFMVEVIQ